MATATRTTTAVTVADQRAYDSDVQTDAQQSDYVTALETQADALVTQMSDAGVTLADTFASLYTYRAWEVHDVTPADYWTNYRGISPASLVLPYAARRALVKATPDASIGDHIMMTGASKATLSRDRAAFGIATSEAKRASQVGKHDAPAKPAAGTDVPKPATSPEVSAETTPADDQPGAEYRADTSPEYLATDADVSAWLGRSDVQHIADALNNTLTDGQRTKLAGLINPVHVASVKPTRNTGRVRPLSVAK